MRSGHQEEGANVTEPPVDLSFVIPTLNESANLEALLPELSRVSGQLGLRSEVIVVDGRSSDGTAEVACRLGARVLDVPGRYGDAIVAGLRAAAGAYTITMDADLSHGPDVVQRLWASRHPLTIGIGSRYVPGGSQTTAPLRAILSRILNAVFARGLSLPVRDLSSGFRIYPTHAVRGLEPTATDFDILPELLVRAHAAGWRAIEVPFEYRARWSGSSKARVSRLGLAYARTFGRLWRLRNSIDSADYDERAYDSVVPLQRYWQRRRHSIVTRAARGQGRVLDVGCGSSRILRDLGDVVGLDIAFERLRYMSRYGVPLVHGSIFALPFADAAFDTVVCSEVIEHIAASDVVFHELTRVLRPGGHLVLGTPDYDTWSWRAIEAAYRHLAPGGYADEHITRYGHRQLRDLVVALGYRHVRSEYVAGSEMILTFEKRCA